MDPDDDSRPHAARDHPDLSTVLEILQTVSGETELETLAATVMRLALAHAGATRGLLILRRGEAYRIEAEARIDGPVLTVAHREAAVTTADLPESAFHYVLRTRENVLLPDASADNPFSADDYIQRHRARSVLCMPLLKQTRLVGVIYLENPLASGVFTPAAMPLLEVLVSHAAITLENARLQQELQAREARVRRLVDSNIIGIVIWHADGRILDTNESFLGMIGYRGDELISGRVGWGDLTPPEWHERDAAALAEVKEVGAVQAYEKEYFRKDGTRVPVLVGGAIFDRAAD